MNEWEKPETYTNLIASLAAMVASLGKLKKKSN
jgi:hypothetical protein